jgi:NNP family nitrate/nitrite transporter-like MFS transporter
MPLLFAGLSSLAGAQWGWRLAMTVPGIAMLLLGIAYYTLTQDIPAGDFKDLGKRPVRNAASGTFAAACRDPRVWALSIIYGACFGMELTIDNIAALYFTDYFHLGLSLAGLVAGSFGAMNLFARALGGIVSDRCQRLWGLRGRTLLLGSTLFAEGLALMLFSRMHILSLAIAAMLLTGLFIKMSNGATYSVVPFINQRALGAVAGVVGAGGNLGAFLAGFFFKGNMPWTQALFLLGIIISLVSFLALTIRFPQEGEAPASLQQFATAGVSD